MIILGLGLVFCLYLGGFIGWMFNLSDRFSMNIGIWAFVAAVAVFCLN